MAVAGQPALAASQPTAPTGLDPNFPGRSMKTSESEEEVEIESRPVKVARRTFLGSLLFWPLFVFAVKFMLEAPGKTTAAAEVERNILVYYTWLYPVAVGLAWPPASRPASSGALKQTSASR
jgi:hypothetical protein